MQNLESKPAFQQPEVVEKKRTTGERFVTVPTHIPGVSLRTEPGVEVDILRKTIEGLTSLASGYAERKLQIDELTSQQKGPNEEIKTLAQTHAGLRGVQSIENNFVLNVIPRDSVTWNHPLLKESAGIAYSAVVHEDLIFAISIPAGHQTGKGPIQEEIIREALKGTLLNLGLSEEDLARILETRVKQRIDEEALEKMIEDGRVVLLGGTKQIDRTWAITVAPLRNPPRN